MLDQKPLNRILFLDIETTSQKENFSELSDRQQHLFLKRFKKEFESQVSALFTIRYNEEMSKKVLEEATIVQVDKSGSVTTKKSGKKKNKALTDDEVLERIKLEVATELYSVKAPIFPEFGRILCISVGAMWKNEGENFYNIKINTFSDEDEKTLLQDFINHEKLGTILDKLAGKYDKNQNDFWALCAFNGRVFDFPFIAKRIVINGLKHPAMFDYAHLKPWEQTHILDPKEAWSYNVFDSTASLDLLCEVFNVSSSKDDIDGSEVKDIFWVEKDLQRIVKYCEKDVLALAQVCLKMKSMAEEVKVFQQVTSTQTEALESSSKQPQE